MHPAQRALAVRRAARRSWDRHRGRAPAGYRVGDEPDREPLRLRDELQVRAVEEAVDRQRGLALAEARHDRVAVPGAGLAPVRTRRCSLQYELEIRTSGPADTP